MATSDRLHRRYPHALPISSYANSLSPLPPSSATLHRSTTLCRAPAPYAFLLALLAFSLRHPFFVFISPFLSRSPAPSPILSSLHPLRLPRWPCTPLPLLPRRPTPCLHVSLPTPRRRSTPTSRHVSNSLTPTPATTLYPARLPASTLTSTDQNSLAKLFAQGECKAANNETTLHLPTPTEHASLARARSLLNGNISLWGTMVGLDAAQRCASRLVFFLLLLSLALAPIFFQLLSCPLLPFGHHASSFSRARPLLRPLLSNPRPTSVNRGESQTPVGTSNGRTGEYPERGCFFLFLH